MTFFRKERRLVKDFNAPIKHMAKVGIVEKFAFIAMRIDCS
jgi:hypothetical protein